ncbi:programmed cell death 1 ligand 1-like [Heterodontus francisci]|uniref:programmed cell death 1 ligand 1-like n=1 Tax=Heterodontus francisci TaxID=7792 RepID=UPI00355AF289
MASRHIISLLYLFLLRCAPFAQKFVTLDCEHSVTGIFNEDTILPCKIKSTVVSKPSFIQLIKDGDETAIFTFEESGKGVQSRIKLLHPTSQDVSLEIQKTQVSDKGTYQYYLETYSGYDRQYITLKVKAPYSLPNVTSFAKRRMRITELICETTGYPLAQIHWYVDEKRNHTSKYKTTIEETPEGLFKIISTLQIKVAESALEGNYTCAVWNVEEHTYEVQKQFLNFSVPVLDQSNTDRQSDGKKSKVLTAVFVIVGALVFGIVILMVCRFRRNLYSAGRRDSEFPMISNDQQSDA